MPAAGVAIANQTQGQVEQGNPTSLLVENSVSGEKSKQLMKVLVPSRPSPALKNGRMRRL